MKKKSEKPKNQKNSSFQARSGRDSKFRASRGHDLGSARDSAFAPFSSPSGAFPRHHASFRHARVVRAMPALAMSSLAAAAAAPSPRGVTRPSRCRAALRRTAKAAAGGGGWASASFPSSRPRPRHVARAYAPARPGSSDEECVEWDETCASRVDRDAECVAVVQGETSAVLRERQERRSQGRGAHRAARETATTSTRWRSWI
jgi:hypothetical protein